MSIPDYFLADLPAEAILTADMVRDACLTIKRNRAQYLADRPTASLIRVLATVAECWLDPEFHLRKLALEAGAARSGFPPATLAAGLDNFFRQLTRENLEALLVQELGNGRRLDELSATSAESVAQRAAFVRGPELIAHIGAGNLPVPQMMNLVLGLLARSAQFVKCASGTSFIPRLFAHAIYEVEPKLGACIEVAEWRGGSAALEEALFHEAELVTVTGSDEALLDIRRRLPLSARFLGFGHRASFGYITHEVLTRLNTPRVVARAAADVVAWNQHGCLSPHVFYVELGGHIAAEQFAELLAAELQRREENEPRGPLDVKAAAVITSRRHAYEMRATHLPDTRLWASAGSTAWTVVYEGDPRFQASCLDRFIYVKGVADLEDAMRGADMLRGKVSTVGLAATETKGIQLAQSLARWGVTRVCPLGQMQNPPLLWRHDGRPSLGDFVTWTDWEQ